MSDIRTDGIRGQNLMVQEYSISTIDRIFLLNWTYWSLREDEKKKKMPLEYGLGVSPSQNPRLLFSPQRCQIPDYSRAQRIGHKFLLIFHSIILLSGLTLLLGLLVAHVPRLYYKVVMKIMYFWKWNINWMCRGVVHSGLE